MLDNKYIIKQCVKYQNNNLIFTFYFEKIENPLQFIFTQNISLMGILSSF